MLALTRETDAGDRTLSEAALAELPRVDNHAMVQVRIERVLICRASSTKSG